MTRRRASPLDRMLGQLPQPEVPPGLARKIVAHARSLPQHPPREAIIAAVPPPRRTLAHHAVGQRLAGLSAFAVAACLIMILLPFGAQREAGSPVAAHAPLKAAAPAEILPARLVRAAEPAAVPASKAPQPPVLVRHEDTPKLAEVAPLSPVTKDEVPPLPVAAPVVADAAQAVEVAGPKASVQGPPVPASLMPANGRAKTGLGVVGGGGGAPASLPKP